MFFWPKQNDANCELWIVNDSIGKCDPFILLMNKSNETIHQPKADLSHFMNHCWVIVERINLCLSFRCFFSSLYFSISSCHTHTHARSHRHKIRNVCDVERQKIYNVIMLCVNHVFSCRSISKAICVCARFK